MDEEWIEETLGDSLGDLKPNWNKASPGTPYLII
jgi:hypothetical protein